MMQENNEFGSLEIFISTIVLGIIYDFARAITSFLFNSK